MTAEERAVATYGDLDEWDEQPAGAQYQKLKEIRFCGDLSKRARQEGIPVGNFYLFDPNVGQGEDPILTDLGDKLRVNIIRDTKRLEVYEEYNGKQQYTVTSSEFRNNDDMIFLYDRTITDGQIELAACLPYINLAQQEMAIKHLKETRYGKRLRTRYLAYCLWYPQEGQTPDGKPEVIQMGFTATDNTGCKPGEFAPLGFQDYSQDSFLGLKHAANKLVANKLFVHDVEVFSRPAYATKNSKGEVIESLDRIKGFRIVGQIDEERKALVKEALTFVRTYLTAKYAAKTLKAYANTLEKEDILTLDSRYIPLLIAKPDLLLGYERMPAIDRAEIPTLQLPESSRSRADSQGQQASAPVAAPRVVEAKTAQKAKKLTQAEKQAEKDFLKENPTDTTAVHDVMEQRTAEQAAKLEEVEKIFS